MVKPGKGFALAGHIPHLKYPSTARVTALWKEEVIRVLNLLISRLPR